MLEKGLLVKVIPLKVLYKGESEDGVYTIISCKQELHDSMKFKMPTNNFNTFTIAGDNLADVSLDVPYDMYLLENESSKYENSYVAQIPILDIPQDSTGQWQFLARLLGTSTYENFKKVYDETNPIVSYILNPDNKDAIMRQVSGIGAFTYNKMVDKIKLESELAKAYLFLSEYGFTDNLVKKIYEKYEDLDKIKKIIDEDIFNLTSIRGVGFKTIDEIYLKQEGSDRKDIKRINSGITYFMKENQKNGNTRVSKQELSKGTQKILNISSKEISAVVDDITIELNDKTIPVFENDYNSSGKFIEKAKEYYNAKYDKMIVKYQNFYSNPKLFLSEYYVYKEIMERSRKKSNLKKYNFNKLIEDYKNKTGFALSDEQRAFFDNLMDSEISFLLGSSGTGKSSVQAVLLEYAKKTAQNVLFLAPTGMARKRIAEVTGSEAFTIHSFLKNKTLQESNTDIYLIDETSMVDIVLAKEFFKVVPRGAKIVFVGDGSQIPSVSCGNFLYDCTNNQSIIVDNFTKVFRQKDGGILDIATKIRQGEQFLSSNFNERKVFGKNCVFDMREERNVSPVDRVLTSFKNVIKTGRYTTDDIIILTPTKKGANGTVSINNAIQSYVNGRTQKDEIASKEEGINVVYRKGDKIINKVNRKKVDKVISFDDEEIANDTTDLVNGDIGEILEIREKNVVVLFDDKKVFLEKTAFRNGSISHGWAITGHKSQGSEFKVVICIFDRTSAFQLNGNLMYTMVSRAKEYLLVMGQMRAINSGLKKFENIRRETNLSAFFEGRIK